MKIAFLNQKGGTGKSTSCINIGAALARSGKSVLLIDMDASGNLSNMAGIADPDETVADILNGTYSPARVADMIQHLDAGYDLIPSNIRTAAADPKDPYTLKQGIRSLDYDYILIDCAPSLEKITAQALTAADQVIIPVVPQPLPVVGIGQILETIRTIRSNTNKRLQLMGILITLADTRRAMDRTLIEAIREQFPKETFSEIIKNNSKVAEGSYFQKDIFALDPKGTPAKSYELIAKEIEERTAEYYGK